MSTSTEINLNEYLLKRGSYCNKLKEQEQKEKVNNGTKRPSRRCAVSSCEITNKSVPKRSFFSFPSVNKNYEKTDLWIKAVQEVNGPTWFPNVSSFICCDHFVNGQHSPTRTDVNYVPTVFPVIINNKMIGNSNFKKIITNVKANVKTEPEDNAMDDEASENVSDEKSDLPQIAMVIKPSEFLKIEQNMQENENETKVGTNKIIGSQKKLNHLNSHKLSRPEIIRSKSPSKLATSRRCSVLKCSVTSLSTPKRSFFSFPSVNKNSEKLLLWIEAVRKVNCAHPSHTWAPNNNSKICSDHFVSGQHSHSKYDVDYVPTLFPEIRNNECDSNFSKIMTDVKANLKTGPEHNMEKESENVSDGKSDFLETTLNAVDKASESLKIEHNMQEEKKIEEKKNEKTSENKVEEMVLVKMNDPESDNIVYECRPFVPGGAVGAMVPPDFGRSVSPISTKGGKLCPPNNTGIPRFSGLPTDLECQYKNVTEAPEATDINLDEYLLKRESYFNKVKEAEELETKRKIQPQVNLDYPEKPGNRKPTGRPRKNPLTSPSTIGSLTCHICVKSFKNDRIFKIHMDRHLKRVNLKHKCPECTKLFNSRYDVNVHMVAIHKRSLLDNEQTLDKKGGSKSKGGKPKVVRKPGSPRKIPLKSPSTHAFAVGSLFCHTCNKSFKNNRCFKARMDLHQGKLKDKCVDCDRILALSCHRHMVADKPSLLDNDVTRNQKGGSQSKDGKPKMSYAKTQLNEKLIAEALNNSSNGELNLLDIYEAISKKYPNYSMEDRKWKSSIRHTLSINEIFVKTENSKYHGSLKYWTFANQNEFKKNPNLNKTIEPEAKQQVQPKSKDGKPNMSYAKLIAEALNNSSNGELNLLDIYKAISSKYPYYSMEDPKWKNSIRHTLSLNEIFVKTENSKYYGSLKYWTFANQNEFKKNPNLKQTIEEPMAKQQLQPKFDHFNLNRGRPKKGHYQLKPKLETKFPSTNALTVGSLICHICNKSFKENRSFKVHMGKHQGNLKDKCLDCASILSPFCHRHTVDVHKRSLLDNENTLEEPKAEQQLQPKFDHFNLKRGRPKKGHYQLKPKLETVTEDDMDADIELE